MATTDTKPPTVESIDRALGVEWTLLGQYVREYNHEAASECYARIDKLLDQRTICTCPAT